MMNRTNALLLTALSASLLAGCAHRSREIGIKPLTPDGLMISGPVDAVIAAGHRSLDESKYGLAISQFRAALQMNPRSATAENGLAIAYASLGRLDLAERHFGLAVADAPGNGAYRRNHDRVLMALRVKQTAIAADRTMPAAYADRLSVPISTADASGIMENAPAVLMLRTRDPGRPVLTSQLSVTAARHASVRRTVHVRPLRSSPVAENEGPVLERTGSSQIMLRIGAASPTVNAVPIRDASSQALARGMKQQRPAPALTANGV